MGIIKVAGQALSNTFAEQWEEVVEPYQMSDKTVFAKGVRVRKGQNTKGQDDIISNGSIVHVYDNHFMMLVDGGKIVDYTAEPGYYKVDNSSAPSMLNGLFNGEVVASFKHLLDQWRFAGANPTRQQVFYINLQEIKGIKFGTRNPVQYFDAFYSAELFFRAHGSYSIKIINPIKFYAEAIPKTNNDHIDIEDINEQYQEEFLQALQASINQLSVDGVAISHVTSKTTELSKYMRDALDEDWNQMRGMEIQAVGISVSYDEASQELINTRNQGAMLRDPSIAQGFMVKNMSEGVKAAGSNTAGAMQGFMGVGMGVGGMGNMMSGLNQMSQNVNAGNTFPTAPGAPVSQPTPAGAAVVAGTVAQATAPATEGWACECGTTNTGKFCGNCGKPAPVKEEGWTCECGATNTGKFCSNCGKPAPAKDWTCECGATNAGKFCSNCGKPRA